VLIGETFAHVSKLARSGSNIEKKNICVKRKFSHP
jgi:hypothetical protein